LKETEAETRRKNSKADLLPAFCLRRRDLIKNVSCLFPADANEQLHCTWLHLSDAFVTCFFPLNSLEFVHLFSPRFHMVRRNSMSSSKAPIEAENNNALPPVSQPELV